MLETSYQNPYQSFAKYFCNRQWWRIRVVKFSISSTIFRTEVFWTVISFLQRHSITWKIQIKFQMYLRRCSFFLSFQSYDLHSREILNRSTIVYASNKTHPLPYQTERPSSSSHVEPTSNVNFVDRLQHLTSHFCDLIRTRFSSAPNSVHRKLFRCINNFVHVGNQEQINFIQRSLEDSEVSNLFRDRVDRLSYERSQLRVSLFYGREF